jgi:hypothetical protein
VARKNSGKHVQPDEIGTDGDHQCAEPRALGGDTPRGERALSPASPASAFAKASADKSGRGEEKPGPWGPGFST